MSTTSSTHQGLEPSRVVVLSQLVEVAPHAIVSRTVARSAGGSVTMFAFDEAQELAEHTAPFDAMVTVIDGELEIRIGGVPYRVAAGEAIVMPAGIPHALRALRSTVMMLVMIRSSATGS